MSKEKENRAIAELGSLTIIMLMSKVFKKPTDTKEFMEVTRKMMKDEDYLPDNMIEMPGDDPEAEAALRELMGKILERRI